MSIRVGRRLADFVADLANERVDRALLETLGAESEPREVDPAAIGVDLQSEQARLAVPAARTDIRASLDGNPSRCPGMGFLSESSTLVPRVTVLRGALRSTFRTSLLSRCYCPAGGSPAACPGELSAPAARGPNRASSDPPPAGRAHERRQRQTGLRACGTRRAAFIQCPKVTRHTDPSAIERRRTRRRGS